MDVASLAIFCAILLTGLPGNAIILGAYAIKPQRKSTDILIIIQALVDLIACITPQPEMISGLAVCWITLTVRLSTSLGSLFLTFAIAVDRYITVCRPLGRQLPKTYALVFAIGCLVFAFLINLTNIWYFEVIDVRSAGCIFSVSASPLQISMKVIQIVSFFIAVFVSMFSYTKIFMLIRRQARVRSEMNASIPSHTGANASSVTQTVSETVAASSRSTRNTWNGNVASATNKQSSFINETSGVQNLEVPSSRPGGGGHFHPGGHIGTGQRPAIETISGNQSSVSAVGNLGQSGDRNGQIRPARRSHGDRTTRMLLCITVVLILSWIPYILVMALPARAYIYLVTRVTNYQVVYSLTRIRGFNHMLNAFVYWAVNPVFRQDVKQVFIRIRNFTIR
ncbi:trace amine-associated receptor 1-like [Lytechinus variegatus]|uniref:trace amine-associated receptor 1-like n=1 Tax=Lytechinus variegatus TaxID=7654 RepID=UPI001BB19F09|nr:trace amine-associated receptor 1-like [Lytechinus variegatus]